jgi:iron complex transport system ATP-binding protein
VIRIENVSFSYGATPVLSDITADIPSGGVTSIIGPNGAGKSTLLSLMARLQPLTSGRVEVGGLDVTETPSRDLARSLAILKQENHMTMRLTVRDLAAFGRFPHSGGRLTSVDADKISEALDAVDLRGLESRYLDQLSGGQRQRAYLAMVLAQDTDYLLLDEPLNNLDMKHCVETMRLVRRLADDFGKTIVLVIHDINFASCYSDHLLGLKDGRVLCEGSPAEVMRSEPLAALYDLPIRVQEIEGRRIGIYF